MSALSKSVRFVLMISFLFHSFIFLEMEELMEHLYKRVGI